MKLFNRLLVCSALAATGAPLGAQTAPAAQPAASPQGAIDQRAIDALEKSRAYLRTLKSFEARVEAVSEEVLDDGEKLEFLNRVRYEYRAPNKLFADWQTDRTARTLFFDGKTATVYAPRAGVYAQVPATGSVADMLRNAAEKQGIIFPLPDLFYWATQGSPDYKVDIARYIGPARLAGVDTNQYFFRQGNIDWQVWIETGDRPVPRKFVITDRSDPERSSFRAMVGWNPDVVLDDGRFTFQPPKGVEQIKFVSLSAEKAK